MLHVTTTTYPQLPLVDEVVVKKLVMVSKLWFFFKKLGKFSLINTFKKNLPKKLYIFCSNNTKVGPKKIHWDSQGSPSPKLHVVWRHRNKGCNLSSPCDNLVTTDGISFPKRSIMCWYLIMQFMTYVVFDVNKHDHFYILFHVYNMKKPYVLSCLHSS